MLNVALILAVVCLGYLLFGDSLRESFRARPTVVNDDRRPPTSRSAVAEAVVNGIHQPTGLVYDGNFELVRATCTACHSAKLVTQNRATREGWREMIRWMQAKQGLWDLGRSEPAILDYLSKHYAPAEVGRRATLDVEAIEWYVLELKE